MISKLHVFQVKFEEYQDGYYKKFEQPTETNDMNESLKQIDTLLSNENTNTNNNNNSSVSNHNIGSGSTNNNNEASTSSNLKSNSQRF